MLLNSVQYWGRVSKADTPLSAWVKEDGTGGRCSLGGNRPEKPDWYSPAKILKCPT